MNLTGQELTDTGDETQSLLALNQMSIGGPSFFPMFFVIPLRCLG